VLQGKKNKKEAEVDRGMGQPESKSLVWLPIVSILMIMAIFLSGLFAPKGWNWALVMLFMIVFIALIGKLIMGRYSGVFIDERRKMSLSRFQLVIWTLIVLSAFLTIALERVSAGVPNPLAIALPTQLWALLGISTASLVGSPLILGTKVQKKPTQEVIKKVVQVRAPEFVKEVKEGEDQEEAISKSIAKAEAAIKASVAEFGILDSNTKFEDAKFSNMFTGDELENRDIIDLAKVQMFFFTLVIAFSYMILLVNLIMTAEPTGLGSFPELSDGLVALLGISSAGYLTNKAPDHTKTIK
jgi:hypothetical protein